MKKLLALVLCVMLFVSVIPTVAFAGTYYTLPVASGVSGAADVKAITAAIKEAIDAKNTNVKALCDSYDAYAKVVAANAIAYRNSVAEQIIDNYDKLVEAYTYAASVKGQKVLDDLDASVEKYYKDLETSINTEIDKIVAATVASVS